jgi:S-adenosylmethionine-diacylglycerol 3-amino-3-carboxypropyl transferase
METPTSHTPSPLIKKWNEDLIRYSTVWEDFRCLESSLAVLARRRLKILSVGSAGDNALSFLKFKPERLAIVDLSVAQTALIELKFQALKELSFDDFLQVQGFGNRSEERLRLFDGLADRLSEPAREYWRLNRPLIEAGLAYQGRLDAYFKKFREKVVAQVWQPESLREMVSTSDLKTQMRCWKSGKLELLKSAVDEFFSKTSLSLEGRHESQFAYVKEENLGPLFLSRFLRLIQTQLISENPYLHLFLTGQPLTASSAVPLLNRGEFESLKEGAAAVEIVSQDLESFLAEQAGEFDFMNLSDVFEYLSETESTHLFSLLHKRSAPGGLIAYWTLLVNREPSSGWIFQREVSERLSAEDRTWFYSGFKLATKASPANSQSGL